MKRFALAASLAALSLAPSASPAEAAVTIGQTGSSDTSCTSENERLQPSVSSGDSYVVPATGGVTSWTITSWSTYAKAGAGQMLTMKVYRHIGGASYIAVDPATYMVVGHDGPRTLTGGIVNTFPANIAVKAGDVLGSSTPPDAGSPACHFEVPGDSVLFRHGNLSDGESGDFDQLKLERRLNVSAVLNPSNSFTLGGIQRNKKKGTATLTVSVPNPGELALAGNGVKTASTAVAVAAKTVPAAGEVELLIKAKGKKRKKLNEKGKVKVEPNVTYTPTGGDPNTQSRKLKLRKR